ncbi:hypothetical protein GCM10007111_38190 [Virgibacillus kapii]|uniref:Uncharacterized protein n=1 Tax=Virgibacillus kapii TaxID=1638645 RepID=A0ABQ2DTU8_9BACI|nr:hypothetical protein [Virgibacillus kapii]GGJ72920.1 hypothetical protein GCM10007111_38190 [Virgibacillus kapii]
MDTLGSLSIFLYWYRGFGIEWWEPNVIVDHHLYFYRDWGLLSYFELCKRNKGINSELTEELQ